MSRTHSPSGQTTPLGTGLDETSPLDPGGDQPASGPTLPHANWERYAVLAFIGEGGMGRVYKGYDPRLRRQVALKFLSRSSGQLAARFAREARLQARINHPAICKVYEVGEVAGEPYIAMQLIEGETLSSAEGHLSLAEKLAIMEDIARGVSAAHQAGLIHRDIKPSNIMIERGADNTSWRGYVMDFGVAREVSTPAMTTTGEMLGTPAYMAPEQAAGGRGHNQRTDVYGLGATIFYLLSGRPPFEGSVAEVLNKVLHDEAPSLRSTSAGTSADLEIIVARCLERDPARRYPTAEALTDNLRRHRHGEPIAARRPSLALRLKRMARKRRAALAVALVAFAGGATALGVWWQGRAEADRRARLFARFGRGIERTRGEMRRVYTSPLHDVRPEKVAVAARLESLEQEIDRLGDVARGPGHYALGSGWLDLRDLERARAHLETAWRAGAHEPEVAGALGRALGGLYERDLESVERISNTAERERRRAELQVSLRDPALAYLRLWGDAGEERGYAEAQIALYERRYDDALAAARRAAEQASWLYEARVVEGDVLLARAMETWRTRDIAGGQALAQQAAAAYSAAAEFGRSDAIVLTRLCASLAWVVQMQSRLGTDPDEAEDRAVKACDGAIKIDANRPNVYYEKSRALMVWAQYIASRSQDVLPVLDAIEGLAGETLRRDPKNVDALAALARAHMLRATKSPHHDGRAELALAAEALERALGLDPLSYDLRLSLSVVFALQGQIARKFGDDPRPFIVRAEKVLGQALALAPLDPLLMMNLGSLAAERASYEMTHGLDPRPALHEAIRIFDEMPRQDSIVTDNLGDALTDLARWERKTGADAGPTLARARAAFARSIADNPQDADALGRAAGLEVEMALFELERGGDPEDALARARQHATRAQAIATRNGDAMTARMAAEVVAARAALARGASPAPFFAAAEKAIPKETTSSRISLLWAELHRRRAAWLMAAGRSPAADITAGLAAAARAEDGKVGAEALVARGALELLDAQSRHDPARAAAAAATLGRALDLNRAMLAREVEPMREVAERLAGGR